MRNFLRYPLVLGLVTALSGTALHFTYSGTRDKIEAQQASQRAAALDKVFWQGYGATEAVTRNGVDIIKVWRGDLAEGPPNYYAVEGSAVGYNAATPIRLLVGFANPDNPPPDLRGEPERVVVGWSAIQMEETPGLGQNAAQTAPPYTIAELVTGRAEEPGPDRRTPFQKQFADFEQERVYTPAELSLEQDGGPIDGLTGATITSGAIIEAIQDADARLDKALGGSLSREQDSPSE